MSYYPEPDAYRATTIEEGGGGGCGAPWFWIILFIVALLVIAALVVALIYAWRRNNKDRLIELKGAKIKVSSDTSLTGIWESTGKDNDKVTLWATLDPPVFNADGTIANSNAKKISQTSSTNSLTLPDLQNRLKYYATLTVSNTDTANYQPYTQLVYMESATPQMKTTSGTDNLFAIEDIIQVGKMQYKAADASVVFNQNPSEAVSLWKINTDGLIENSENSVCLYNNNGNLITKDCTEAKADLNNSKWTYNQGNYANQWCLSNSINTDSPVCMVLGNISNGTASISVSNSVNAGDAFVNAFETPK